MHLAHLPDLMPGTDHHYKELSEVFGTETDESARPSLKTGKDRSAKMPFNVVKQHATNTNLLLECAECNKPRLDWFSQQKNYLQPKRNRSTMRCQTCYALVVQHCCSSKTQIIKTINSFQF